MAKRRPFKPGFILGLKKIIIKFLGVLITALNAVLSLLKTILAQA